MSVLRAYEDAALTQVVSISGAFTNPDDEANLDGTNGDNATKQLWVAPEQTKISGAHNSSVTTLNLVAARFADTDYSVIINHTTGEKCLITAGHGTTTPTVTRGYNGTTAQAMSDGDVIGLAYDCTGVTITGYDTTAADGSVTIQYIDDNGSGAPDEVGDTYETTRAIGALAYNASVTFHRKITIASGTPAAYNRKWRHRIAAPTVNEYAA